MEHQPENLYIARADKVEDIDVRAGMAKIFGEGFTQWLGFFSKDQAKIGDAFAHSFVLDQFYIAVSGDEVAGMTACTDCKTSSIRLNRKALRQHLGLYRGFLAGVFLKKEFERPFPDPPQDTGSIEFVGTSSRFRGQGVASQIIGHILENTSFAEYVISEVADTNTPAMKLYEKLGFVESGSKPVPAKKVAKIGINRFVSLKLVNPRR